MVFVEMRVEVDKAGLVSEEDLALSLRATYMQKRKDSLPYSFFNGGSRKI
jgi:hypothetical protein